MSVDVAGAAVFRIALPFVPLPGKFCHQPNDPAIAGVGDVEVAAEHPNDIGRTVGRPPSKDEGLGEAQAPTDRDSPKELRRMNRDSCDERIFCGLVAKPVLGVAFPDEE